MAGCFPERFLPGPAVYEYTTRGIEAVKPSEYFKDRKKFMFSNLQKRLVVKKLPTLAKEFLKNAHSISVALQCRKSLRTAFAECVVAIGPARPQKSTISNATR